MKIFDLMKKAFKSAFSETRNIKRIIVYAGIALVLVVAGFGGYYYIDRYIHIGDQSPLKQSIQDLEAAVRKHPEDVDMRLALAESYLLDQQYDHAIEQASQVLKAYPDNDRAMFVVGVSYTSQSNFEKAISPLEQFVAIRSEASTANIDNALETALYYLGDSYNALERYSDAIKVLSQAVQINITDADAFYQLGFAYAQTGQHVQAIQAYSEAVRFVPNFTEAYQEMVTSYSALNQTEYATYARGMLAFSMMDYETARVELEKVTTSLPDYGPGFLGLGLTYEALGDLQSAKMYLVLAVQIDPNDFTSTQALGRVDSLLQK
jgi:tetratricopeptide (TPR) repeat protein